MTCNCGSMRIISVSGKTSDMCSIRYATPRGNFDGEGEVPCGLGIGGGNYLSINFCADCGLIQKFKRLTDEEIIDAINSDN